jgi:GTPase SAR1 family protein
MVPAGYIRGSVGICVCFDVTNRKSFERLDIWITQVQSHKSDYSTIILVGCKSDAPPEERQISYEEGVKLAEIYGWQYTETSSKLNRGVTELFEDLASTVYMNLHGSEHRDQIVPPHLRKPADSARTKKSGGGVGGWFKKILGWK